MVMIAALAVIAGGAVGVRLALRGSPAARTSPAHPQSRSAQTVATTPPPSAPARGRLVIHAAGDVSLDPDYIPALRTYGYEYAWSGLGGLFQQDDLTVVNLECPAATGGSRWPGKEFNFRCDPAALPAMHDAGVEVALQGNNHAYDYGPEALLESRKHLLHAHIAPVGSGRDPDAATKPAFFEINGWRVAVLGFDQVLDPEPEEQARPGHPGTACGHDVDCMVEAIERAGTQADLMIVAIHWGVERDRVPEAYQVDEARRFMDAGADVIFGGHSHRLQPMEIYRGRPIFYSLGNFVWPNNSAEGSTTAVAEVTVSLKGRIRGKLLPAYIESPGHPVLRT